MSISILMMLGKDPAENGDEKIDELMDILDKFSR